MPPPSGCGSGTPSPQPHQEIREFPCITRLPSTNIRRDMPAHPGEPPEELLAAVQDQAEARVRADIQGYAKYLTPAAVDSLRASFPGLPPRVAAPEIEKRVPQGADHVFDIRYSARDESFVVRSRWRKQDDGWMVVHAE